MDQEEDLSKLIEIFKESIFNEDEIRETFEIENFNFNDTLQNL